MTTRHSDHLLQIASAIEAADPLLAYELAENVTAYVAGRRVHKAVINPGFRKFEETIEGMVTVLKSLDQELSQALEELDTDDAKEFSKFFEDVVDAENEELRRMLKKTEHLRAASRVARLAGRTAGPLDFVKNLFKKDKKKAEPKPESEEHEPGSQPSYRMDEGTMDDFVEGKADWASPGHYIEKEMEENKEFFDGANQVLKDMEKARKEPSKPLITKIKKSVESLIRHGENLLNGIRKHLLEPTAKVDTTQEGLDDKKKAPDSKLPPEMLESTVNHYTDMLKESLGDEKKTLKYLKELFQKVGPMVQEERATLAARRLLPSLIRSAYASDGARKILMPVIIRIRSASTEKI